MVWRIETRENHRRFFHTVILRRIGLSTPIKDAPGLHPASPLYLDSKQIAVWF
jgi:hypothetical protein